MNRMFALSALTMLCIGAFTPSASTAQWEPDGVALATWPTYDVNPVFRLISDGQGGTLLAWEVAKDVSNHDVYVQRLGPDGAPLWDAPNGLGIATSMYWEGGPDIVADGAGGAIVVWEDARSGISDIYAQHINALGTPQWAPGGIAVCSEGSGQYHARAASDGAGGAVVVWEDSRYGYADTDIYAQLVNASGSLAWGAASAGRSVCGSLGNQYLPLVTADGAGGAVFVWHDTRTDVGDIYAQRITGGNVALWASNGRAVVAENNEQNKAAVTPDGSGGVFVTWQDARNTDRDIFAQHVEGSGALLWIGAGAQATSGADDQIAPRLAADGTGGVVVVWQDFNGFDIGAQRLDAVGVRRWGPEGMRVCDDTAVQQAPDVAALADGTFVVAWADQRNGVYYQIHAQRIDRSGADYWADNGVDVVGDNWVSYYPAVVSDGGGGAVVAWADYRATRGSLYAQRLEARHGAWGYPEPAIASVVDSPGDQGGAVVLAWDPSDRDRPPHQTVAYYSTWRSTTPPATAKAAHAGDTLAPAPAVWPNTTLVASPSEIPADFQGSAVWVEESPSGVTAYWEWLTNVNASYREGYSLLAPTRSDSSATGPATHWFQVIAHTWSQYVFWESLPASGHSTDNLAPAAPSALAAARTGGDNVLLEWTSSGVAAPDFRDYAVYRGNAPGVAIAPANLLVATTDTTYIDPGASASQAYFYVVVANDIHGNGSAPTNEAGVTGQLSGVGDTPGVTRLTMLPNAPNPFNPSTAISFALPSRAVVTLAVYDQSGRRVVELLRGALFDAGVHTVAWHGVDDAGRQVPAGVYFGRLEAGDESATRKMMLVK